MFEKLSVRGRRATRAYRLWSWLLVLMIAAPAMAPSSAEAASRPSRPPAYSVASSFAPPGGDAASVQAAPPEEETGPDAVVPDVVAKRETVRRTQFTRTDLKPDGTYETVLSPRPMHFLEGKQWRPFDPTLRAATTPGFTHAARAVGHEVSFDQATDVAAGRPVMRVSDEGASVAMIALGARPSAASVSGGRIRYQDAYGAGTSLTYEVDNEIVKEAITLAGAPATASQLRYAYELQLVGLTAAKKADNSVEFSDASGEVVFRMPRPFMYDSNASEPEKRYSDAISVSMSEIAPGKLRIEYAPDFAWVSSPERRFPLVIDPSVERVAYTAAGAGAQAAPIYEGSPTLNASTNPVLDVGKRLDGLRRDSLLRFPELDTLPQDSAIISGMLHLYAGSGTVGMPMHARRNTAAWDDSTVTWNTAPAMAAQPFARDTSVVPGWNLIFMSGTARDWVQRRVGNHGLRVMSTGSAGQNVAFDSAYGANPPRLVVAYVPATRLGHGRLWSYAGQDHGGGNGSSVNLSTGNLVFQHEDASVGTLTYNSQDPYGQTDLYDRAGAFYGEGWTFSESLRLYERDNGNAVVFKEPTGGADRVYTKFTDDAATSTRKYFRPLYYEMTLTKDLSSTAEPSRIYTLTEDGSTEKLHFDGQGKLTEVMESSGGASHYMYDVAERLTAITDPAGRKTTLEYAGPGTPARLSKITDMAGRVSTYGYDAEGNLTTIRHGVATNPDGTTTAMHTTTLHYGVANHLIGVTNPRGHRSNIEYRVENRWDAAGDAEGWAAEARTTVAQAGPRAFRGAGSLELALSGVTDTLTGGASRTYATPVSLNSVQQELRAHLYAPAGTSLNARLVLEDGLGKVVAGPLTPLAAGTWTAVRLPDAHVDPGHKVKKLTVQVSAPAGAAAYTGSVWLDHVLLKGVASYLTDRSSPTPNIVLKLGYDWEPRLQTCGGAVQREGACTTVSHLNHAGGYTSTGYVYDSYGLATSTVDPLGRTTDAAYDEELRLIRTTAPNGAVSSLTYHPGTNEVHTTTAPTGESTRQGSNAAATGRTHYSIDPRNEQRRKAGLDYVANIITADDRDNILSEEVNRYAAGTNLEQSPLPAYQAQLRRTSYTYDAVSNMTSMTDPKGNITKYIYNLVGELTRIEAPAGAGETAPRVTTFTRNRDGTVQEIIDPKGQITTREHDNLGRLRKINYGVMNGVPAFSTSYEFDANGNVVRTTDKEGVSEYAYDGGERLLSESRTPNGGVKRTATNSYHSNGVLQARTTFAGQKMSYAYDTADRLVSQTDPNDLDAAGNGRSITYSYDGESRPVIMTFPSGVSRRVFYGAAGDLRLVKLQKADGTVLQSFEYDTGYGADGKVAANYWDGFLRTAKELDGSTISYTYDDLGRLVSAVRNGTSPYNHTYTYDASDNRIGVHDGLTTTSATYDAANQLVSQAGITYSYDKNGNLLGYGGNSMSYDARNKWISGTVEGQTVSFAYDGEGQRVSRTIGGARTDYWYDSMGLAQETGAASATYLRDLGGGLLSRAKGGFLVNYGVDRLGNITALTGADGVFEGSYTYDPWGKEIGNTTAGWYNPHRYTGAYQDGSTGIYQMGARYLQPGRDRFTQADPLASSAFAGQRFGYTPGNPVNYTDTSGLNHKRLGGGCVIYTDDNLEMFVRYGRIKLRADGNVECTGEEPNWIATIACVRMARKGFDRMKCGTWWHTYYDTRETPKERYTVFCGYTWDMDDYNRHSFRGRVYGEVSWGRWNRKSKYAETYWNRLACVPFA